MAVVKRNFFLPFYLYAGNKNSERRSPWGFSLGWEMTVELEFWCLNAWSVQYMISDSNIISTPYPPTPWTASAGGWRGSWLWLSPHLKCLKKWWQRKNETLRMIVPRNVVRIVVYPHSYTVVFWNLWFCLAALTLDKKSGIMVRFSDQTFCVLNQDFDVIQYVSKPVVL